MNQPKCCFLLCVLIHGVLCANDVSGEDIAWCSGITRNSYIRCPNIAQLLAHAFRCTILGGLEKNKNTQPPMHLTAVTSIFFIQNFDEYHLQKQTYNITGYSKKIKIKNF
jgi:hypothetical protein